MKVFSKEKYIEKEGKGSYKIAKSLMSKNNWVDVCDGKEVTDGRCEGYLIDNAWCIEKPTRSSNVRLILGKFNNTNKLDYWNVKDAEVNVGDYAIVPNKTDYEMVKVIAIVTTKPKYYYHLTKNEQIKDIVRIIPREEVKIIK